jgi:hypothetical protein
MFDPNSRILTKVRSLIIHDKWIHVLQITRVVVVAPPPSNLLCAVHFYLLALLTLPEQEQG